VNNATNNKYVDTTAFTLQSQPTSYFYKPTISLEWSAVF